MFKVKNYIWELIVFVAILAVLIIDLSPDYTFVNKSLDSMEFIYCAKYFYIAHQMSVPLYLIIGHVFLWIPFGTEYWRIGLISIFSTMVACGFIYLIIKHYLPQKRWYALIGVLICGLSALVISQSVIVQTYPLIAMLIVGAYYFALTKHWKLMVIFIGLGLAVHVLTMFAFIILLIFFKEYRNWKLILMSLSFLLFYLYIPLRSGQTFDALGRNAPQDLSSAFLNLTTVINYFGGTLSLFELPKRILDTLSVILLSIGVITIVPLVKYFWRKDFYKQPLFWLCVVPIVIFLSNLDMQTYDYMLLAMPFLVVAICIGLSQIKSRSLVIGCLMLVLGFGGFNAYYFNVGQVLDKDLVVSKLFNDEFAKLQDNAILIGQDLPEGTILSLVNKFNKDYGKQIRQVQASELWNEDYRQSLEQGGISIQYYSDVSLMAKSVIELNDKVWVMELVNPQVYEFKIIEANHDSSLIQIKNETQQDIELKWKPSNPYSILTSSLYLTEWRQAILSTFNFRFLCVIIVALVFAAKFIRVKFHKKNELEMILEDNDGKHS